jgi:uncharacterized membrane protein
MLALVLGAAAAGALAAVPNELQPLTRALFAWDISVAAYILAVWVQSGGATIEHLTSHAAEAYDGRYFVLIGSVLSVAASLTAVFLELQARLAPGLMKNLHLAFVFGTVALSWLFVHTSFAKHYAHDYYGPREEGIRKGLIFPGDPEGEPDFADFFHFALVIGVAAQTADIQIAARAIRRVVTLHGVIAFVFNTVILALTINLAAVLFQ